MQNAIKEAAIGVKIRYFMFQKCRNSINLPAVFPLNASEGAQVVYTDPTIEYPMDAYADATIAYFHPSRMKDSSDSIFRGNLAVAY